MSSSKSRVYFSPNVSVNLRSSLCDVLGFHSTPNLGKYLGFPLKHVGLSSQDYSSIIERVHAKLAGWKANLLSFASRVVLSQATISAIPSYISSFGQAEMEIFPWNRVPWTLLWYMVRNKIKKGNTMFSRCTRWQIGSNYFSWTYGMTSCVLLVLWKTSLKVLWHWWGKTLSQRCNL